jgi:hypothetical protein
VFFVFIETFMGKWAPDNYKNSGMSKGAYLRSQGQSSGGSNDDFDVDSIIDEILGATPGFREPEMDFDEFYDEKMQKEDKKLAESMFNPYYERKIADSMEDLKSYIETESIDYKRTLRQGRARMAQLGGAIGSERTSWEGEVGSQYDRQKQGAIRQTERSVGSDAIKEAGFTSNYGGRTGTLIDERNAAIADQTIWYRDQAMNQHNSGANKSYQRPSEFNVLGNKL